MRKKTRRASEFSLEGGNRSALESMGRGSDTEGDGCGQDDSDSVGGTGDDNRTRIGEDESKAVNRVMSILMFVLLAVAASVSSAVFLYSRGKEEEHFRKQFVTYAEKLIDDVGATTARSLRAIEGFALQITIHAIDHHQEWPMVALSDFEGRARITIDLADAISLIFLPIVKDKTRLQYEAFCQKHQNWLTDSLAKQHVINNIDDDDDDHDDHESIESLINVYGKDEALRIRKSIFRVSGDGTITPIDSNVNPGPYTPWWQFAPAFPVSQMINYDILTNVGRQDEIMAIMETERTIVGKALDYVSTTGDIRTTLRTHTLNLFLNRRATDSPLQYTGGPVSDLYSPVFDHFGEDRQMVGIVTSYVYWQVYLENVLPENIHGMIVVLENTCGQAYTFHLDGAKATYIGPGDLHDPKYDKHEKKTKPGGVFLQEAQRDLKGQCEATFRVYPSEQMEQIFLTSTPLLFMIVLASTFLFTSFVFLWYQCLVDRRQKVVMKAAVQSTEVVKSLFPANVRDRIFEEAQQQQQQQKQQNNASRSIKSYFTSSHKRDSASNPSARSSAGAADYDTTGLIQGQEQTNINDSSAVVTSETIFGSKPIADLFPNTTIIFADMVGFTAWASIREPTQVFTLLETVYHSFDLLAKSMRVFKVETVGDCYVAVAGLPTPRKDHAVVMARFAWQCRNKMRDLSSALETTLGPDTADLAMRIGLHSGPATAGVLRGDKGRFQLFGDTINTASRMESTGMRDKIHMSRETADLLIAAGKAKWVFAREGKIVAKGKGELQTYWLMIKCDSIASGESGGSIPSSRDADTTKDTNTEESRTNSQSSTHQDDADKNNKRNDGTTIHTAADGAGDTASSSGSSDGKGPPRRSLLDSSASPNAKDQDNDTDKDKAKTKTKTKAKHSKEHKEDHKSADKLSAKQMRLVQWNVDVLLPLLKQIMLRRATLSKLNAPSNNLKIAANLNLNISSASCTDDNEDPRMLQIRTKPGETVLDEFKDIIMLPKFNSHLFKKQNDPDSIQLSKDVIDQLTDFVKNVFIMYHHNNPFHNFEHASHVTMSVIKLLSRIVNPAEVVAQGGTPDHKLAANLHDHTFGITSDPLTQFACVFSALIHDLDHPGVTNTTLVSEETELAKHYKNKSVAEQNSVDLAWDLLMNPKYDELRCCIYGNEEELRRFRQLVVNVVMATDIMDKDLGALRKARWEKAFSNDAQLDSSSSSSLHDNVNNNNSNTSMSNKSQRKNSKMNKSSHHAHRTEVQSQDVNRKATIVIEHLIQASDVAHTMQHWHVYRKWNERLFHEMYSAYKQGRTAKDPSEFWYKGEIGFFDFYILPLAKKLETCGVFGVSSDEYLNYALANRREWEERGEQMVADFLQSYQDKFPTTTAEN